MAASRAGGNNRQENYLQTIGRAPGDGNILLSQRHLARLVVQAMREADAFQQASRQVKLAARRTAGACFPGGEVEVER